jgi:hypothetical protein
MPVQRAGALTQLPWPSPAPRVSPACAQGCSRAPPHSPRRKRSRRHCPWDPRVRQPSPTAHPRRMPTSPSPPSCPARHSPTTPRNPSSAPTLSYPSVCTSSPLPSFIFPNHQHTRCLQNRRPVLTSPSPTCVRSSPSKPPRRNASSPFVITATSRVPLHPEAEVSANSPSQSLRRRRVCAARLHGKRLLLSCILSLLRLPLPMPLPRPVRHGAVARRGSPGAAGAAAFAACPRQPRHGLCATPASPPHARLAPLRPSSQRRAASPSMFSTCCHTVVTTCSLWMSS